VVKDLLGKHLVVGYWWTGKGGSGLQDSAGFQEEVKGKTRRRMPPFGIELVEKVFVPWLLKYFNRADLTAYEYAINYMFAKEHRRFVKGSGKEPWLGSDFDQVNADYKSLRATLNDEDGVEKSTGGATRLSEDAVPYLLGRGEEQWAATQLVTLNQLTEQKAIAAFSETMAALTGITLMARSNSSGGIGPDDVVPHPSDGSVTIKVRTWARKGQKKRGKSKAECRTVSMRIPPGKAPEGGGEHPRNRYISLMCKLKELQPRGGGMPQYLPKASAAKMSALIKRVLGGRAKLKAWMFEKDAVPSSHSLRKTGATMAERAGAPRSGRFLQWGGWEDPRALVNYTKGEWSGTGFSYLYFDWLVDYSI
jgi:hypothetical protein